MTQYWASSTKKLIKLVGFILAAVDPTVALALSAAVIVCRAGLYDNGSDDMMMVLRCSVDKVDPI